ncbi:hypothetical protein [Streptosporangium vulgare]|uniref:Secreted protein n=1 Tax=Streptosporangium vulgare TaxID=46190 RepID=A0ABV5TT61_9ACTN
MRLTRRNRPRALIAVITSVVPTGTPLSLATPSATAATVDTNSWQFFMGSHLDIFDHATCA